MRRAEQAYERRWCCGHHGLICPTREVLVRMKEASTHRYLSRYHTALVYAGLENDEAFAWLEKAYEDHLWMMAFLKVDPRLDVLRSDPRYADLVRRVGLPP